MALCSKAFGHHQKCFGHWLKRKTNLKGYIIIFAICYKFAESIIIQSQNWQAKNKSLTKANRYCLKLVLRLLKNQKNWQWKPICLDLVILRNRALERSQRKKRFIGIKISFLRSISQICMTFETRLKYWCGIANIRIFQK